MASSLRPPPRLAPGDPRFERLEPKLIAAVQLPDGYPPWVLSGSSVSTSEAPPSAERNWAVIHAASRQPRRDTPVPTSAGAAMRPTGVQPLPRPFRATRPPAA